MDEATWAALTATLTIAGLIWTWLAFRRRGAANGLRALGFTLLPAAAWLTGTLEMVTEIGASVTDWATSLVFSPFTWAGVGLAGLSALLFLVSGVIRDRQLGRAQGGGAPGVGRRTDRSLPPGGRSGSPAPAGDDDLADIEALLRKRGIQ